MEVSSITKGIQRVNIIQTLRTCGPGVPSGVDQEDFAAAREKVNAWNRSVFGSKLRFGSSQKREKLHMETEETEENAETDGIPLQAAILIHFDRVKHVKPPIWGIPSLLSPTCRPFTHGSPSWDRTCQVSWMMAAAYWETAVVSLKYPPQHDASHVLCENECKSVTYNIYYILYILYYTLDYVLPLCIYIYIHIII